MESYKSLTKENLFSKVLDFGEDYNELSITGGEPLLCARFLKGFLPFFKAHRSKSVYLETNGTLPEKLEQVIDHVDIVAMDFKLPSSTGGAPFWKKHRKFAEIAARKELIVKAIITDSTNMDDIKEMSLIVRDLDSKATIVLQPVTPVDDRVKEPDKEMILYFKEYIKKETGRDAITLGQAHKELGIR